MTFKQIADDLLSTINHAQSLLESIPESKASAKPQPNKWSAKEIIGHLIDSASNNHQRFVRAQFQDHLTFAGYDQDAWVARQRYQDAPWRDLITLWASYNRHLARVMASVPEPTRTKPFARHNLHELAWQPVAASEPATLDYFMRDYVGHLKHHLRQILGEV